MVQCNYRIDGDIIKKAIFNGIEYEIVEDYRNAFSQEMVGESYTEYFSDFDYILGDYSYDKLRLKGFCEKENPLFREINDIEKKDVYLSDLCSFGCRYFLLKKVVKK